MEKSFLNQVSEKQKEKKNSSNIFLLTITHKAHIFWHRLLPHTNQNYPFYLEKTKNKKCIYLNTVSPILISKPKDKIVCKEILFVNFSLFKIIWRCKKKCFDSMSLPTLFILFFKFLYFNIFDQDISVYYSVIF